MIYSELKNYLVQSSSPELVSLFDRAIDILEAFDVEDYMNLFDASIGENIGSYDQAVTDGLRSTLDDILTTLLIQHTVVLTTEATLSDKLFMLTGLLRLQNWEDKVTLMTVTDSDQSDQEVFAELIAVVNNCSIEKVLILVESFNPSLLEAFKRECLGTVQETLVDFEDVSQQISDYSKVKQAMLNRPIWSDRLLPHAGSIGMPYLLEQGKYYSEILTPALAGILAQELVGLVALSEEGLRNALQAVRTNMSELCTDLNNATKLDIAVGQFLLEVNRA
jgi:hypothetical protein